jgi:hypothetical protein
MNRGESGRLARDDNPVVVGGQDVVLQKRIDRRREHIEVLARRLPNLRELHTLKVRVHPLLVSSTSWLASRTYPCTVAG